MKHFPLFLSLLLTISITTAPLGSSGQPLKEDIRSAKTPPTKTYEVHFLSLTRGHTIATSDFHFEAQNTFIIAIPFENFLSTKGTYTKDGLQFKAQWEGTTIKRNKHYSYTFIINGVSLLDAYIAGIMNLKESIKESTQEQQLTFLFLGTRKEQTAPENKERSPFPF